MATTAVNIRRSGCDTYCGRGFNGGHMNNTVIGKRGWLGNPYPIEQHGRDKCIELFRIDFEDRIASDPEFAAAVRSLYGRRLGCFCKPYRCHVDVIVEYLECGK